jgi:hypothetical protein
MARAASLSVQVPALALALFAGLLIAAGTGAAGGSGYNLSYSAAANSSILPAVDLVAVSTSYASGPNLTASLTVAGTPVTDSSQYSYIWLFGGGAAGNSSAWAFFENKSAYLHSPSLGFPPVEPIGYTLSGSTLSISVDTSLVGPASGFTFNGEASQGDSSNHSTYSYLGTDYQGSGSCTGSTCTGTPSGGGSTPARIPIGAILWPVVIVVVILIVVLLVRRRRRARMAPIVPPPPPSVYGGGTPPPPPTGLATRRRRASRSRAPPEGAQAGGETGTVHRFPGAPLGRRPPPHRRFRSGAAR